MCDAERAVLADHAALSVRGVLARIRETQVSVQVADPGDELGLVLFTPHHRPHRGEPHCSSNEGLELVALGVLSLYFVQRFAPSRQSINPTWSFDT